MGNYHIGIDMAAGDDQTMYCISKSPGRFMRWLNRLLRRGDKWKIVYCGPDPNQIRKWQLSKTLNAALYAFVISVILLIVLKIGG